MYPYEAPLDEMRFLLDKVFDARQMWAGIAPLAEHIDMDTALAILDESANLSKNLVYPLNRSGDEQGVSFADGQVITPEGYQQAYQEFVDGGWIGLCGELDFGGMGMPKMLGLLVDEMGYGACNAFTLYNSLTAGAALCIHAHGTDELKQTFLPKLYSGEWSGAMDMTEPQAGSDLRNIRTKAEPQDDDSYLITGSKIFITGGDHDLTENVIHLVLAKLPDSNGLSLFLVPKFTVNPDQSIAGPNGVTVGSIEHKMGLKGSATCVMNYDNARGFLIGKANRGLVCMFTMMNYERLAIGIQGLGCSQAAYQMAGTYAKERLQGQAVGGGEQQAPLIVHGDVRRMLLTIASLTEAGRALALHTGQQLDLAKFSQDDAIKAKASRYVGLLTPVAKAFLTDRGLDVTIMAQQVFGGHGYIRESGIEQLVRDTRIAQIYEGTNGIQALDFLGRKVLGDNLETLQQFIDEVIQEIDALDVNATHALAVKERLQALIKSGIVINQQKLESPHLVNAVAVDYLDAFGYAIYGYYWLKMSALATSETLSFKQRKQAIADFYINKLLAKSDYHLAQVNSGEHTIMAPLAEWF
ncbi:MAG: acyl-CoA dehydrogenase family protein [Shewanella sp.]